MSVTRVRPRARENLDAMTEANVGTAATTGTARRGAFLLTFDFEDWHQLVYQRMGITDWRPGSEEFEQHLATLLDLLDELGVRATFFATGLTADRHPAALSEVVAKGHEVGCHGYEHRRACEQTPDEFRRDLVRCVETVERICGVRPVGYRAPWFSITRTSLWALEIVRDLGFRYDSSFFDSPRIPRRIQPIPAHPFRLDGDAAGLWEFPVAAWRRGRLLLPLGGGAYWRLLPDVVLWPGLKSLSRNATYPVLYFHPYEFAHEPLCVVVPADSSRRTQIRETWRRVSKNARLGLIQSRLREAAARFQLVPVRDALATVSDDVDATLLRQARAGL